MAENSTSHTRIACLRAIFAIFQLFAHHSAWQGSLISIHDISLEHVMEAEIPGEERLWREDYQKSPFSWRFQV
jgi:hypothetical protein